MLIRINIFDSMKNMKEKYIKINLLFKCRLQGRVRIKKNNTQRRYSFKHKRTFQVASDRYRAWEEDAVSNLRLIHADINPLDEPLCLKIAFHFKNRQHEADTSNCLEGPQDALAKAGIIKNDRLIKKIEAEAIFGEGEFVDIEIYSLRECT